MKAPKPYLEDNFIFLDLCCEGPSGSIVSKFKIATGAPDSYVRSDDLAKIGRYSDSSIIVTAVKYKPIQRYPGKGWLFDYTEKDKYSVIGMDLLALLDIENLF